MDGTLQAVVPHTQWLPEVTTPPAPALLSALLRSLGLCRPAPQFGKRPLGEREVNTGLSSQRSLLSKAWAPQPGIEPGPPGVDEQGANHGTALSSLSSFQGGS